MNFNVGDNNMMSPCLFLLSTHLKLSCYKFINEKYKYEPPRVVKLLRTIDSYENKVTFLNSLTIHRHHAEKGERRTWSQLYAPQRQREKAQEEVGR